jgi:hypothetical protein
MHRRPPPPIWQPLDGHRVVHVTGGHVVYCQREAVGEVTAFNAVLRHACRRLRSNLIRPPLDVVWKCLWKISPQLYGRARSQRIGDTHAGDGYRSS